MHRKNYKRIGDSLAFNTAEADPIFQIIMETELGYAYMLKTTPYGDLKFVWKELVAEPEVEENEESDESAETVSKKKQK